MPCFVPLRSHIRAPLALDDQTSVYGLLARRSINDAGTEAAARQKKQAPVHTHIWEMVLSAYPFDAWKDLWTLSIRLKDADLLTVRILHVLESMNIKVLQASAAVTFSGVNDSIAFILDCTGYSNDIDSDGAKRPTRERWRLRFLETLLTARMSRFLNIENDGRPSLRLQRLDAYRRIWLRLNRVGLLDGQGAPGSSWQHPLDEERLQREISDEQKLRDRSRIQVVFSSRIGQIPEIVPDTEEAASRQPRPIKMGMVVSKRLGAHLASAINRSASAAGMEGLPSWDAYCNHLTAMSMFDSRDMLLRCLLTATAGATRSMNTTRSSYLQIALLREQATPGFLKELFKCVNRNVAAIEKYAIRPGFVKPPQCENRERKARRDALFRQQRDSGDICRVDMVVVLKNDPDASLDRIAATLREHALKEMERYPNAQPTLFEVFPESDWGTTGGYRR